MTIEEKNIESNSHGGKKAVLKAVIQFLLVFLFLIFAILYFYGQRTHILLLHENTWLIVSALIMLEFSALYTFITSILTIKKKRPVKLHVKKIEKIMIKIEDSMLINGISAIVNIIVSIFFFYFGIIFTLNWQGIIRLGVELQIITLLIFYGLGIMHLVSSLQWMGKFIKEIKTPPIKVKLTKGMMSLGLIYLFLLSSIGVYLLAIMITPRWSSGLLSHQDLFITGETYEVSGGEPPITGYRIPSLLWLPGDTLLAFAEARQDPWDDGHNIDIVMRRSIDGGDSWEPLKVIAENGPNTAGNPCPVYDEDTRTIHLVYNHDNEEVWTITSKDKGLTWSTPKNITKNLGLDGSFHGCGPGVGIQLKRGNHAGRLVIPSYGGGRGGSHLIYSDDHGKTWHVSNSAGCNGECQIVESIDGSLYLNIRSYPNRKIVRSRDGGITWTSCYSDPALPDVPCQAGVYRFTDMSTHKKNRILYCGPNYRVRGHYTIRMSYDEGLTWPIEKELYAGPSAYGQLVVLSDYTMVLLLECGTVDYREGITVVKFDLNWLTNGQDQLEPF